MEMKRGDKVWVCHDGKWSRRVEGVVVDTRRGHHIKVQFPHPEDRTSVEFWARKKPAIRYWRTKKNSCVSYGKSYTYYGGWADIDWWFPWYAVYKFQENFY